jgi:hypothetical protein
MSILLILFLLFGLVLGGFGDGSSSSASGSARIKPVVKCSKQMTTDQQPGPKCGPPPAKP